ncbi:MAG: hypothetical protein WAL50_21155 [Kineosporiaceae bacterium]
MGRRWGGARRPPAGTRTEDVRDRTFRTKSSEELTGLHITLEWARAAGLIRSRGNTLVTVKKHAGLVDRPTDLLTRMVTVLGDLEPAVCPSGWGQSILHDDFPAGVQLLLTTMDLHPDGVDVAAVVDQLGARLSPLYRTDELTDLQLDGWRRCLARDVWLTVELLAETGLVAGGNSEDGDLVPAHPVHQPNAAAQPSPTRTNTLTNPSYGSIVRL